MLTPRSLRSAVLQVPEGGGAVAHWAHVGGPPDSLNLPLAPRDRISGAHTPVESRLADGRHETPSGR